ncbi:MAG: hypothetical protein ACJAWA_001398 [Nonlabens sp.]|jgi:hypothetical protein
MRYSVKTEHRKSLRHFKIFSFSNYFLYDHQSLVARIKKKSTRDTCRNLDHLS